jgi:tryptophan synthase beta chain
MVARFQSVVSEEIKIQLLEKKEEKIHYLIACVVAAVMQPTHYHLDNEEVNISS